MCVTGTASKSPVTGRALTLALLRRDADTEAPALKGGYGGRAMRTAVLLVEGNEPEIAGMTYLKRRTNMARNIVISIRDGSVSCVYGLDADDRVIVLDHDTSGGCDAVIEGEEVNIVEADIIEKDGIIDLAIAACDKLYG